MSPQNRHNRKIPFTRHCFAFCTGIIVGLLFQTITPPIYLASGFLFLIISVALFSQKTKHRKINIVSTTTLITIVLFGCAYSSNYQNHLFSKINIEGRKSFSGYIINKNAGNNNRTKYTVKLNSYCDTSGYKPFSENIFLYNSDSTINSKLFPGKHILFETQLYPIPKTHNPGEFNYYKYCLREGIRYQCYIKSGIEILKEETKTLTTISLNLREKLLQKYKHAGFKDDVFAILAALTLGEKSYLSSSLKQSFSNSGAFHVLAVSGLHVGIIYLVLKLLLKPLLQKRETRFFYILISILFLWGYAFITGLSPSVLRATTMFSVIIIGETYSQNTNTYNSLLFSAFILMLINPLIIYKTGFQLSYSAVTSIVFFQPKIAGIIKQKNKVMKYLWELFAVSIAAQIGTFPLTIFYFHQFPVYFWLSNFIVIPAATLILYGAVLFFFLPQTFILSKFIAFALKYIITSMNFLISKIETLPYSLIQNIDIDRIMLILFISSIILITTIIIYRKAQLIQLFLITQIILFTYSIVRNTHYSSQELIIFYNNYKTPLVSFIDGKNHYYYSPLDSLDNYSFNILNNSAQFYHTQIPQKLSAKTSSSRIRQHNTSLLFKFLHIKINNKSKFTPPPNESKTITWDTKRSFILINNEFNKNYIALINGKKTQFTDTQDSQTTINLRANNLTIKPVKKNSIRKKNQD